VVDHVNQFQELFFVRRRYLGPVNPATDEEMGNFAQLLLLLFTINTQFGLDVETLLLLDLDVGDDVVFCFELLPLGEWPVDSALDSQVFLLADA
jgi:hypothetical protein